MKNHYEKVDESRPPTKWLGEDGVGLLRGVNEHGISFTRAADWRGLVYSPTAIVRHTTSSRRPGVDVTGVIQASGNRLVECEFCKRKRVGSSGPHSPQLLKENEVSDCVGQVWRKEGGTWRLTRSE